MNKDPIAAWKKMLQGKREWREHVARVEALPPDYRMVMEEIERYMWNFAQDATMIATFDEILDLFEESSAAGRPVLEVTGDDVAGFAQNVQAEMQAKTWEGKKSEELNARIHSRLGQAGA